MTKETKYMEVENEYLLSEVGRLLEEGHDVILDAKGCSMLPFIVGDRDSVELEKCTLPKLYDIALARVKEGTYVLHRIIRIEGETVTLMGDGNLRGCETCGREDILGVVKVIIKPSGKRVSPSDGRIWRRLKPFRRYILAIYRRLV